MSTPPSKIPLTTARGDFCSVDATRQAAILKQHTVHNTVLCAVMDILGFVLDSWSSWTVTVIIAAAIWLSIAPLVTRKEKDGSRGRRKLCGRPLSEMPSVPAHWLTGSSPEISRDGHHTCHVKWLAEYGTVFR